jgi:glycine cleavage system H protein
VKPEELRYSKTHEWVHVDQAKKIATVGISKFALEALTDLVFIDLPPVGRQVKAGDSFGEVESVKAVSDLYSPVTGEIVEVNRDVAEKLETLSEDPYGKGWLVRIKIADDSGLDDLLDHASYQRQIEEEMHDQ